MAQTPDEGASSGQFGRLCAIFTGGFFAVLVLIVILEQSGVSTRSLGYLLVGSTVLVYALIGIVSRTGRVPDYYVANRGVPAMFNGMATAASWMPGAVFAGLAGTLYALGYDGLAFVLGWTGGHVLVAVLLAPYLRKSGVYTVPGLLGARYGGNLVRFLGVLVLLASSFTLLVAQIYATGIIASRFLGLPFEVAVYAGLAVILASCLLGGMRSVTWTQVAQYVVLIIAYLVPVAILSAQRYSVPVPQLMYGQVLQDIAAREQQIIAQGLDAAHALKAHMTPFQTLTPLNFFGLIFCLMVGTASLPHILMRSFTTPSVRQARKSVTWSLFFVLLLAITAPTYAAFAKLEIYTNVIGQSLDKLPHWMNTYSQLGLVDIYGVSLAKLGAGIAAAKDALAAGAGDAAGVAPALKTAGKDAALAGWSALPGPVQAVVFDAVRVNGAVTAPEVLQPAIAAAATSVGNTTGLLDYSGLSIDKDVIMMSTPEIAGMPYVVVALVAVGGLAAALSTAGILLLAIANALGHDIYYKMIDTRAPAARRLTVSRIMLVAVALGAAYVASTRPADLMAMVAWCFSIAASGLFPALVLGVWWKRASTGGAVFGIIAGFGTCLYYLVGTRYYAVSFQEMWGNVSGAGEVALSKYAALRSAWEAAAPEAKAAAWTALDAQAQKVANWFGVSGISSALFGLPAGFLGMIIGSLLTAAPSRSTQAFIDDIRQPRGPGLIEGGDAPG